MAHGRNGASAHRTIEDAVMLRLETRGINNVSGRTNVFDNGFDCLFGVAKFAK